jgi:Protein of unknown function (DUF3256)
MNDRGYRWLFVIITILLMQGMAEAQNIDKLFIDMPIGLNPSMTRQNRTELIEYHKSQLSDSMENRFGNKVFLLKLDTLNQLMVVKTSPISVLELKRFKSEKQNVVGLILTVCAPVCQSSIEFYTLKWEHVDLGFVPPKSSMWLKANNTSDQNTDPEWVSAMLENSFVSLSFSADKQAVVANNNSLDFTSEEDRKALTPLLESDSIMYSYTGATWNIQPSKKP